ncbi:hypothetical protein F4803DRAFT_307094 [Xylaria telfairii]|nr:hypothetical protein F4803DRAFT_307094 [Xylaria telfairii]
MAEIDKGNNPSLSELYFESIGSFAKFVLALSQPDCDAICRNEVHLPQIFEQYGRTKIWGDQSKADLPASARGSLDDTLRHDDDLKSLVRSILQRLKLLLQQAILIAQRKYDPGRETDQDSISSVSDSDYSTDNEDESQRRKMPKIRLFVQQIADQIQSLHEISALLRRPTVTNKFIRSVNVRPEAISTDELRLSDAFGLFDEYHILEKVLEWRGLGKSLQSVIFSDEAVATFNDTLDHREVERVRWFCQRLARANTRRRQQLRYWKNHPYDSKKIAARANFAGDSVGGLRKVQDTVPVKGQKEDLRSQASTLTPRKKHLVNEEQESVVSKMSFSTVAFSDVHDTMTNVRPRTIYAPTTVGRDRLISVPGPPRTKDSGVTFPCPYCGMILASKDMSRQFWKRHVFRDLRPYICTFKHCNSAEKLFSSRHEWKYHEFQIHRREYVCQRCKSRCISRSKMSMHLQEHYGDSIPSAQMDIILDLCDRQVDSSDDNTEPCILCGEEHIPLSSWHDHVAGHMESLSLFVLPAPENDEDETRGSIISGGADVLGSQDEGIESVSTASSLGFSATGDHGQEPAQFAECLAGKEVEYNSKPPALRLLDEHNTPILSAEDRTEKDPRSPEETFEELKKSLGQNLENANREHILRRMGKIISDYNVNLMTSAEHQRLVQMQIDLVQLNKTILGDMHALALASMLNLASTYRNQDSWEQAELLQKQVVEARKAILGAEHSDTLASIHNLALTYQKQSRWEKAEPLLKQLIEIKERILGAEHPDTLASRHDLALTYQKQGRKEEAEPLLKHMRRGCVPEK